MVDAVHAVAGWIPVHSQATGAAAAVTARVDSLEHGMCLSEDLLDAMAKHGTALTPTLWAISSTLDAVRQRPESAFPDSTTRPP